MAIQSKEVRAARSKAYHLAHKEERAAASKLYYRKHKKERKAAVTARHLERLKSDPMYKVRCTLRTRLCISLGLKSWKKDTRFKDYIGCTLDELKSHLAKQFQPGMTWANQGEWHIDHIKPLATATSEKELYDLCHYSNLQPLWAIDNLRKGSS